MATKTIAFRLNPKNREDKEILDWLDSVVYEDEIYACFRADDEERQCSYACIRNF